MEVHSETRLAIDPQILLKDDVDRAILITRPPPLSSRPEFCHYVHPTIALILSLFNGEDTLDEIKRRWVTLSGKPGEEAAQDVDRVVDSYSRVASGGNVFIEVDGLDPDQIIRYEPKDFVLPRDQVNLTEPRFRKPYVVYYLPSLFCPQKCIYCYAKTCPRPETELIGLDRLREIFQELKALGVDVIGLSGGDPLARKDIHEIVRSIVANGIIPDIPTKVGLSLRRIQEFREMGVELMQVSLDSSESAIVDRMVGVRGYHNRVFRVLRDLRKAGMKVRTNSVVTPLNVHTIPAMLDFLGEMGNVITAVLTPYGRSLFCHRDELFVDLGDLRDLNHIVKEKKKLYPHMRINLSGPAAAPSEDPEERRRQWEERSLCTGNRVGFVILPDGRVTVCEELYDHPAFIIGDLTQQSVMEMWNSPEARALAYPDQAEVPEGPCKACESFEECNEGLGRCWRDVLKSYGWEKPHYPDPRCPLAPKGLRLG